MAEGDSLGERLVSGAPVVMTHEAASGTSRRTLRAAWRGFLVFPSLHGYQLGWLPKDAVAGIMLLAIALPGLLATARLAGMPPESGLLAFAAGAVGFAAFGAHRFASVAADPTIAPIFAGTLAALAGADPARYSALAALLALLIGVFLRSWAPRGRAGSPIVSRFP